jgi:methionyl-tRNA formyltransferase
MRVVVLGTSALTMHCADAWRQNHELVGVVSMPLGARPDNSTDLEAYAVAAGAAYLEFTDLSAATPQLRALRPDILFSTWPKLLSRAVIESAPLCIGSHWSELPANRGRHPLHWMIALGMTQGAISFFKMDDGIDTGDILLQIPFDLDAEVRISDALDLVHRAAVEGCRILASVPLAATQQDHSKANYWRKRTLHDTVIDFRMSRSAIDRLVRSYCLPFPGAKISYKEALIPIDRAAEVSLSVFNLEPGRILAKGNGRLIVKADDGAIELFPRHPGDLDLLPSSGCIHPPAAYANDRSDLDP